MPARSCFRAAGILFLFLLANVGRSEADDAGSSLPTNTPPSIHTAKTNSNGVLELLQQNSNALTPEARAHLNKLVEAGANLEQKDADKRTALTLAVLLGDLETVQILVQAGANIKARDRFHKTPLLYAVKAGRRDIVDYLASNGDLQSPTPQERKERQRR
jgi:ankyrin repeat protein